VLSQVGKPQDLRGRGDGKPADEVRVILENIGEVEAESYQD